MRANRKMRDQQAAQVGIGTMIVFIATVLVAAIAAGVLIDTSGKLQERSSRTGDQATKQVASNLVVERVVGLRDATGSTDLVRNITLYVSLAPGASRVDLKEVKIQLSDGANLKNIGYQDTTDADENYADESGFNITRIRDADSSMSSTLNTDDGGAAVMTSGDLAAIRVSLHAQSNLGVNMELNVRKDVLMTLVPEIGASVRSDFVTPESFGTQTWIELV